MTGRPRRIRSPAFWAKVASAAIGGEKTLASLAGPFDVHPSRNEPRPPQLRVGASGVFGAVAALEVAADVEMRTLHATIGELTLRNDFLSGAFGIGRSGACCPPRTTSDPEPAQMRRIGALHLEYPLAGSRVRKGPQNAEIHEAGRLHVSTPMRVVGALYGGPNTSNPAPGHKVHPSLLRKPAATRPDRVRIMDMVVRTGEEAHTDLLFLATADAIHRRASCRECPVQAAAENPDCVPMRTEKYLAGLERAGAEQESPAVRQPETRHLQLGAFAAQDRKGS